MKILYCKIGWMDSYQGIRDDHLQNGGAYNKEHIGGEAYNYLGYKGKYYGYVEPGLYNAGDTSKHKRIQIENLGAKRGCNCIENTKIVWIATKPTGGQFIIGWYDEAVVYRELQNVPDDVMGERELKTHNQYNIYSENVTLIPVNERKEEINGMGRSNIWYGNDEINGKVIEYINNYNDSFSRDERIAVIEEGLEWLEGSVRKTVIQSRVNQDKFREQLLRKYHYCCLCAVNNKNLLIASHIKPWVESDKYEKLDPDNGLLLCPNHDKLFDLGYISFSDEGNVLVSDELGDVNGTFMNINNNMKIDVNETNKSYIIFHREHIFKK